MGNNFIITRNLARNQQKHCTSSDTTIASTSSSTLLQLECEIKQIQLDTLRKFKELQQQMSLQSRQIYELQNENKELRAALRLARLR